MLSVITLIESKRRCLRAVIFFGNVSLFAPRNPLTIQETTQETNHFPSVKSRALAENFFCSSQWGTGSLLYFYACLSSGISFLLFSCERTDIDLRQVSCTNSPEEEKEGSRLTCQECGQVTRSYFGKEKMTLNRTCF